MRQENAWGETRDPKPPSLLMLTEDWLRPHTAPPRNVEAPRTCTGWFIYKYTDVSFFVVVSIFCVCGKRQKVGVEGRVGVAMWQTLINNLTMTSY